MSGLSGFLPATDLRRVQLAALAGGCLIAVSVLLQRTGPVHGALWNLVGRAAMVGYMIALAVLFVDGRLRWWQIPLLPFLITIGSSVVADPLVVMAAASTCAMALALYGGTRVWLLTLAAMVATVPATVALTPESLGRALVWHDPSLLGLLPSVAIAGLTTRGIRAALLRLQRSAARDAVVARTGTGILTVTDLEQLHAVGQRAAAEVTDLYPGLVWLALRRITGQIRVRSSAGPAGDPLGRIVPDEAVADPGLLAQVVPGPRHWRMLPMPDDAYIAVGAPRPVPDDVLDTFRALANQVVLGGRMIESWEVLDHRANHDELTRLANRARFFDRLTEVVGRYPPGAVALINIDLDDFKAVNDTFGHGAGDALLVEIAARLRVLEAPALAARLGGDEFAVLLAGVARPGDAEMVAVWLRDVLIQPVQVTGHWVRVGASIGVALTVPGESVAELSRRADLAMYAAKAEGKNQVRISRHPSAHLPGQPAGGDHRIPA